MYLKIGSVEEDDADPFVDIFFDGDLMILEAIYERLKNRRNS